MRQLTNAFLFTDSDKEPLDGYLYVYEKGTVKLADLTDDQGVTRLANPQPVSNGLPDNQIFIENIDVDVVVKDEDDVQVMSYSDLFSGITGVIASSVVAINTIADLRLAVPTEACTIALLGYYSAGDKNPVLYRWTEDPSLVDDSGYVIGAGDYFWVAKAGNTVDVRDYGYFPNGVQFTNGKTYRWYFPYVSDTEHTYHLGSVHLYNPVFDKGVIITGDVSMANVDFPEGDPIYRGYVSVKANDLKSSMMGDEDVYLQPYNTLTLDTDAYALTTSNCDVLVRGNYANELTLTNCRIRYLGGSITGEKHLTNCEVDGRCFVANEDDVMSGCTTDADTWSDGDDYVAFMITNGNYRLDLRGKTMTEIENVGQDIIIDNAVFGGATIVETNSTITLNKCSGEIVTILHDDDDNWTAKAVLNDCDLSVTNQGYLACKQIKAVNCSFNCVPYCESKSSFNNCTFDLGMQICVSGTTNDYQDIAITNCVFKTGCPTFFPYVDFDNTESAEAGSVYVDNVLITGNIFVDSIVPAEVNDTQVIRQSIGTYSVVNNGSGLKESVLPNSGTIILTDIDPNYLFYTSTSSSSGYVYLYSELCSTRALTWNFGELYNTNVQKPIQVKARLWWSYNGTTYSTSDADVRACEVTFEDSAVPSRYQLFKRWTQVQNSGNGLYCADGGNPASSTASNRNFKLSWGSFDNSDFLVQPSATNI